MTGSDLTLVTLLTCCLTTGFTIVSAVAKDAKLKKYMEENLSNCQMHEKFTRFKY